MVEDNIKFEVDVLVVRRKEVEQEPLYNKIITDMFSLNDEGNSWEWKVKQIKESKQTNKPSYEEVFKQFSNDYAAVLIDLELPKSVKDKLSEVYEQHLSKSKELDN